MAELVAIAGPSGSGKSTSIKDLDSKETYLINISGKSLPFKGSQKLYNVENKNYYEPTGIIDTLNKLKVVSEKAPHIKQVIIDDSNYLQTFNMMGKALETGYTKFTVLARDIVNLIQEAKKLRSDLIIYYVSHTESVEDGEDIVAYKLKTIGKMLDNQVVLEGLFTIILYTHIECKGDDCSYYFVTNKYGKYLSKSPFGMFTDLKIPNNLQIVSDTIREYYN
jgi:cytidylate kinase